MVTDKIKSIFFKFYHTIYTSKKQLLTAFIITIRYVLVYTISDFYTSTYYIPTRNVNKLTHVTRDFRHRTFIDFR